MDETAPNRSLSTLITLVVLLGVLAVFAVVGLKTVLAPVSTADSTTGTTKDTPKTTTTCRRTKSGHVTSSQVTVSVFNAGSRAGLASETLNELVARGFQAGATGNAAGRDVDFVQVWSTQQDDAAAKLVGLQFGATTVVRKGPDLGKGIDVVVGDSFHGLVRAQNTLTVPSTDKVCSDG